MSNERQNDFPQGRDRRRARPVRPCRMMKRRVKDNAPYQRAERGWAGRLPLLILPARSVTETVPGSGLERSTLDVGRSTFRDRETCDSRAFTLLEVLLSITLVAMLLIVMNFTVFSMGELWGRGTDRRLFDQHVTAVTRFLENELRTASMPPFVRVGDTAVTTPEIKPISGLPDNLLTFTLPSGSRLMAWPDDRPLPEVVCSLQVRENEGLVLLWHSTLETKFNDDPPRETVISSLVTELDYDYYDSNLRAWSTETELKKDSSGQPMTPQRLRLKFSYDKMTRQRLISLPTATEGVPVF